MAGGRRKPEWRDEPGPGYQLRRYERGRPTEWVAAVRQLGTTPPAWLDGVDVLLATDEQHLVIEEHAHEDGVPGAVLRIPRSSCVNAQLSTEVGLPGGVLLRLTLTYRLGGDVTVTTPLWFRPQGMPFLQRVITEVNADPATNGTPSTQYVRARSGSDWLVFRSVGTSPMVRRKGVDSE